MYVKHILYLESSTVCHITYKVQLSGKCVFILYAEAFEGAHHRGASLVAEFRDWNAPIPIFQVDEVE